MDDNQIITSDQILKASEAIKKIKPGYAQMLDLYEKIFAAQEDTGKEIKIKTVKIPEEILSLKIKESFPLAEPSEFQIDSKSATKLFIEICGIIAEQNQKVSGPVKKIAAAVDEKNLDAQEMFSAFLGNQADIIKKISADFGLDENIINFIIYNSLKPSLSAFAGQVSSNLDKKKKWGKGYCPMCGSPAILSVFENDGKRFLHCSFCWHKWASERIYCPYCENTDHETLHYYDFENEEEHRADVCDKCKKYIKTVDTRKLDRLMYPPLEHVATAHIDIKIQEMGYASGAESE